MQQYTGPPLHPVDGGWAWMVCLATFVANFFVNGGTRSLGIVLVELTLRFNASAGVATIAIGLIAAGFAIFAALGNGFGIVLTNRVVALVGALFMFVGTLVTAYAPNIYVVIVFLGIFSGIGYGFLFGPSMVSVGQYFEKRRSLANGMAVAGGSIGQLALPLFINAVVTEYGFQGGMLLYSGLMLHAIPAAMLLRPPQFYHRGKAMVEQRRAQAAEIKEDEKEPEDEDHNRAMGSTRSLDHIPLQEAVDVNSEVDPDETPATPPARPSLGVICCLICQKLFDRTLLKNCVFLLLAIGVSFGHNGYLNVCFLLPPYAARLFQSKATAAMVISVMGVADLAGRIGGGWFADFGLFTRPAMIGFSFVVCGAMVVVLPFFPTFPVIITFAVLFGLIGGTYLALLAVVVVDLFGLEYLPAGMGLSTMMMGLTLIPLPSVMGILATATQGFGVPLRVCGGMLFMGGILYYTIVCIRARRTRRTRLHRPMSVDAETQAKPSDFFDDTLPLDKERESYI